MKTNRKTLKKLIEQVTYEMIQRESVQDLGLEQILYLIDVVEDSIIHYDILLNKENKYGKEISKSQPQGS